MTSARTPGTPSRGQSPLVGFRLATVTMAATLMSALLFPAPVTAQTTEPAPSTSFAGEIPAPECTITGTARADVLRGTPGDDVVCGLGGNDVLRGLGGDDLLVGGTGRDQLLGGRGDDALDGGPSSDRLVGGPGQDSCATSDRDDASADCTTDAQGPEVSDVSAPAQVAAGSAITVTWRVADASNVAATFVGISGRQGWASWCNWLPARLSSGTEGDGTYSVTCQVPENAINDTFSIWIGAADMLGNATWLEEKASFAVIGGSDDFEAPTVSDVALPASARPGETITVTWRAQDATGVDFAFIFLRGPADSGLTVWGSAAELVEGDGRDGTYTLSVEIPADEPYNQYDAYLWIGDGVNNRDVLSIGGITVGSTTVPERVR